MVIGVDPGLTGGIAAIHDNGQVEVFDTPTLTVRVGKKLKNIMDVNACALMLQSLSSNETVHVVIEKVSAMPNFRKNPVTGETEANSMGATSAFNFGVGYGTWLGIIAALQLPHEQVHPTRWKAVLMKDMGKEKDASRAKAMQLYPQVASQLSRKKDHGRAEALLLAHYGLMQRRGPSVVQEVLTADELPF